MFTDEVRTEKISLRRMVQNPIVGCSRRTSRLMQMIWRPKNRRQGTEKIQNTPAASKNVIAPSLYPSTVLAECGQKILTDLVESVNDAVPCFFYSVTLAATVSIKPVSNMVGMMCSAVGSVTIDAMACAARSLISSVTFRTFLSSIPRNKPG